MKFSLVIPLAPDREAEIIESLQKMDYPRDRFHIIVVKGLNPSENRNRGSKKARGEIIGFLDDDGAVEPDYLRKVEEFFENYPEIDVVGGPQLTPKDEKGFAKISGYALSSKLGSAGSSLRYKPGKLNLNADERYLTSANLFVRKEVMEKIHFDPSLWPGEDPKFIEEAKKAGLKIAYSPEIIMYHRRRPTAKSMMKQIFNYGRVRPAKESFLQTLKKPQFIIPSICILYTVFILFLIAVNPSITGKLIESIKEPASLNFFLILPFIAYLVLLILFTIYNSAKNKDLRSFFVLPFVYLMIHVSYGIGIVFSWFRKPKDRRLQE